jgi:hypothetical protein
MPVEVAPPGAVILETVQTSASDWRCWRPSTSSFEGGATMPCSDLFWMHFLDVFPKALGGALGILPAVLGFWGGLLTISRVLDAREERQRERREAQYGLGSRVSELERRVISFESHRQRGNGTGA